VKTSKDTSSEKSHLVSFSQIEKHHPYKTFLFFALIGSGILFLSFSFLFYLTITRNESPTDFLLPKSFALSTILILLSSLAISRLTSAYRKDSFFEIRASLLSTLSLTSLFILTQIFGWLSIYEHGYFLKENIAIAYLFIISGIHFLHVIGGFTYLAITTYKTIIIESNIAKTLMFFSDNYHFTRFQLIQWYWHFLDFMWVFLYLLFLYTL